MADRLAQTLDPREVVRLNERLGRVLYRLLKQPEAAVSYLKAALDRDARHRGVLDTLRELYEETGQAEELVGVLRRLVPLQESAEGVKALRLRLAEVLSGMGRREEALDAARRALEVEPHAVADLERVHALFVSLRAYNDAVRALELKVQVHQQAEEREQAVAAWFAVADLWAGAGNKPELAGGALEKVLELDPANRTAYERACELYRGQQRLAGLRAGGGSLPAAPGHRRGEAGHPQGAGEGAGAAARPEGRGLPGALPRAAARRVGRHAARGGGAARRRDGLARGARRRLRGGGGRAAARPAGRAHVRHAGARP